MSDLACQQELLCSHASQSFFLAHNDYEAAQLDAADGVIDGAHYGTPIYRKPESGAVVCSPFGFPDGGLGEIQDCLHPQSFYVSKGGDKKCLSANSKMACLSIGLSANSGEGNRNKRWPWKSAEMLRFSQPFGSLGIGTGELPGGG